MSVRHTTRGRRRRCLDVQTVKLMFARVCRVHANCRAVPFHVVDSHIFFSLSLEGPPESINSSAHHCPSSGVAVPHIYIDRT
jgi:hypothetical protein